MESFDILFPVNLSALTYRVPDELKGLVKPGQLIRADIRNTERIGLVFRRSSDNGVKPIKGICSIEPLISSSILKLIEWMSDYYVVNKGLVFKTMYSKEFFEALEDHDISKSPVLEGRDLSNKQACRYCTLLFHVSLNSEEFSLLSDLVKRERNIIILAPERSYAERVAERLNPLLLNDRCCLLHGDLSKRQRIEFYSRIISGRSDVVIGTRVAVFAPLKKVSVIVVLKEEDDSYKNIQGVKFHARDVAVMRGYFEKAKVILTSAAPSVESYYNAIKGKYQFIRYGRRFKGRIEIIDMGRSPKVSPYISKRVIETAKAFIRSNDNLLFLVNRKGYSLIRCSDCDYIEGCENCKVPLVYYRDRNQLLCHYCGRGFKVRQFCPVCGGATLQSFGAGIQRIEAEIRRYLDIEPLRLEKGVRIEDFKAMFNGKKNGTVVVSTGIIKQLYPEGIFKACFFMNPDIHLQFPDFRSGERLFRELHDIKNLVALGGLILIQTRFPENHVYKAFKRKSIEEFYDTELSIRRSLLYPPFSRFGIITIRSDSEDVEAIEKVLNSFPLKESIHSCQSFSNAKKRHEWRLIFKSTSKKGLHERIRQFISTLEDKKGRKITIDIDPQSLMAPNP